MLGFVPTDGFDHFEDFLEFGYFLRRSVPGLIYGRPGGSMDTYVSFGWTEESLVDLLGDEGKDWSVHFDNAKQYPIQGVLGSLSG